MKAELAEAVRLENEATILQRHGHLADATALRKRADELRARAGESRQLRDPGVRFG